MNQDKEEDANIVSQYALEYLRHKLVAHADIKPLEAVDISLDYRWQDRVGSYTDFAGSHHSYKPYGIVDAHVSWALSQQLSVYGDVNNLLNTSYVDYGNVPQPGISAIAGLRVKF